MAAMEFCGLEGDGRGRFASFSLLQVTVGLARAMGEWKIDKSCLSC